MKKIVELGLAYEDSTFYECSSGEFSLCTGTLHRHYPTTKGQKHVRLTLSDVKFPGATKYDVKNLEGDPEIGTKGIEADSLCSKGCFIPAIYNTLRSLRQVFACPLPEAYSFWALVEPSKGGDTNED